MLNQRRRRWAEVVQILYRCYVFAEWELEQAAFPDDLQAYIH